MFSILFLCRIWPRVLVEATYFDARPTQKVQKKSNCKFEERLRLQSVHANAFIANFPSERTGDAGCKADTKQPKMTETKQKIEANGEESQSGADWMKWTEQYFL